MKTELTPEEIKLLKNKLQSFFDDPPSGTFTTIPMAIALGKREAGIILSLLTKQEEQFKPCGEWENICNCKSESECGYLEQPQANDVGKFPKSTWEVDALRRKVKRLEAEIQSLKQANAEWISVKDGLPKNGQEVLLFRKDAGVFQGFYGSIAENLSDYEVEEMYRLGLSDDDAFCESFWFLSINGPHRLELDETPSHWMPLPTHPEELSKHGKR